MMKTDASPLNLKLGHASVHCYTPIFLSYVRQSRSVWTGHISIRKHAWLSQSNWDKCNSVIRCQQILNFQFLDDKKTKKIHWYIDRFLRNCAKISEKFWKLKRKVKTTFVTIVISPSVGKFCYENVCINSKRRHLAAETEKSMSFPAVCKFHSVTWCVYHRLLWPVPFVQWCTIMLCCDDVHLTRYTSNARLFRIKIQ